MGWLDPLSFLLLFLVFRFCFYVLASETYMKSHERASKTIILHCTTLPLHHTSYTITSPPPVLASSRRSIGLVHQRRSSAPFAFPPQYTTGRRGGGRARRLLFYDCGFSSDASCLAGVFEVCLGHSFSKIGRGADGRDEGVFFS